MSGFATVINCYNCYFYGNCNECSNYSKWSFFRGKEYIKDLLEENKLK